GLPSAFIVTPSAVQYIEKSGYCSNNGGEKKYFPLPNRRVRVEIPAHIYPIVIDKNGRIIKLESTGSDCSEPVILSGLKEGEEIINYVGLLPEILMGRAGVFAREGDFVSAFTYCDLAKETCQGKTSTLWMKTREAKILLEASRLQAAKEVLLAIDIKERTHEVWFLLSNIYLRENDLSMARRTIEKALELKPENTEYQSLAGDIDNRNLL
ncbi:MAG: tetratricopeptide repeat protein, partial [bacterium]